MKLYFGMFWAAITIACFVLCLPDPQPCRIEASCIREEFVLEDAITAKTEEQRAAKAAAVHALRLDVAGYLSANTANPNTYRSAVAQYVWDMDGTWAETSSTPRKERHVYLLCSRILLRSLEVNAGMARAIFTAHAPVRRARSKKADTRLERTSRATDFEFYVELMRGEFKWKVLSITYQPDADFQLLGQVAESYRTVSYLPANTEPYKLSEELRFHYAEQYRRLAAVQGERCVQ